MRNHVVVSFIIFIALLSLQHACVPEENTVIACFGIPDDTLHVGEELEFSNCCEFAERYEWDFGDSTYSEEEAPSHIFTKEKKHTVILRAYRNDVYDSIATSIYVFEKDPAEEEGENAK